MNDWLQLMGIDASLFTNEGWTYVRAHYHNIVRTVLDDDSKGGAMKLAIDMMYEYWRIRLRNFAADNVSASGRCAVFLRVMGVDDIEYLGDNGWLVNKASFWCNPEVPGSVFLLFQFAKMVEFKKLFKHLRHRHEENPLPVRN